MNGPRTRLAAVVLLLGPVACSSTSASGGSPPTADSTVAPGPKCAAAPKQVLTENDLFVPDASGAGISAGMDIAVSATDLYVGVTYGFASSAILRTPIRGGAPVVVAAIPAAEQGFVLTGDSLVFAQANQPASGADGAIVKIGLHDGTRTVLASASIDMGSIFGPSGILATDGMDIYFAASDGTKAVPLAGGDVRALTTHTGPLVIIGSNLVIADSMAESIFSIPLSGGDPVAIASNLSGSLGPIVACGPNVCWASAVPVAPSQPGTAQLMQLAPPGMPVSLAESNDLYVVHHLAFDGSSFYATMLADASIGVLARVPAGGGAPMLGGFGDGLALDDECIYVGDVVKGVYSVAKAGWSQAP